MNNEEIVKKLKKDIKKIIYEVSSEWNPKSNCYVPFWKIEEELEKIWDIDYDYSNFLTAMEELGNKEEFQIDKCIIHHDY